MPILKQAACHGLFQNGPNKNLLIGLTGFKMGQILNRAVTYIPQVGPVELRIYLTNCMKLYYLH